MIGESKAWYSTATRNRRPAMVPARAEKGQRLGADTYCSGGLSE